MKTEWNRRFLRVIASLALLSTTPEAISAAVTNSITDYSGGYYSFSPGSEPPVGQGQFNPRNWDPKFTASAINGAGPLSGPAGIGNDYLMHRYETRVATALFNLNADMITHHTLTKISDGTASNPQLARLIGRATARGNMRSLIVQSAHSLSDGTPIAILVNGTHQSNTGLDNVPLTVEYWCNQQTRRGLQMKDSNYTNPPAQGYIMACYHGGPNVAPANVEQDLALTYIVRGKKDSNHPPRPGQYRATFIATAYTD